LWCVLFIFEEFAYTPGNGIYQPFSYYFLSPNPVLVHINGVPIMKIIGKSSDLITETSFLIPFISNWVRFEGLGPPDPPNGGL